VPLELSRLYDEDIIVDKKS